MPRPAGTHPRARMLCGVSAGESRCLGSRPSLAGDWTGHMLLPGLSLPGIQPCAASVFPPGLVLELYQRGTMARGWSGHLVSVGAPVHTVGQVPSSGHLPPIEMWASGCSSTQHFL